MAYCDIAHSRCERTKLISKVESKSQRCLIPAMKYFRCERTKLISKVESKSQHQPLFREYYGGCERTKLISKVESKSQLTYDTGSTFEDVKELS